MFFQKWSLKTRIICAFTIVLLIPTLIVSIFSYTNTKIIIFENQTSSAQSSLQFLDRSITETIQPKLKQLSFFSTYISNKTLKDEAKLNSLLEEYLALHPEVAMAYVGTAEGQLLSRPVHQFEDGFDPRTRPWYVQAVEAKGNTIITDPYVSSSTGDIVVTIAQELQDQSGVVGIDLTIQTLAEVVNSIVVGEQGYTMLLDNKNHFITAPNAEVGTEPEEFDSKLLTDDKGIITLTSTKFLYSKNEATGWTVLAKTYDIEAIKTANQNLVKDIAVILVSLTFVAVFVLFFIRSILRPLRELSNKATLISNGDLTVKVEVMSEDELGHLSHVFNTMRENLHRVIEQGLRSANNVRQSSLILTESASSTIEATDQTSHAVQEVASSTEQQLIGNEQNAQTMQRLATNIMEIANRSQEVTGLSSDAINTVNEGNDVVQSTVIQMNSIHSSVEQSDDTIRSLSQRIEEIGSIVDVINNVASQTNLLALNAAIEAARAGEHGKGFAVVAQQVRVLAENSKQSTDQINELIKGIQHDTSNSVILMEHAKIDVQQGLKLIDQTAEKFQHILTALEGIAPKVHDVTAHAQEMASAVEESSITANSLALHAQGTAASAQQVAASTEEIHASMGQIGTSSKVLLQLADELQAIMNQFKV